MSALGDRTLDELLAETIDHPERVIHERIAWHVVQSLVAELGDDAELGRRVRHAVAEYRGIPARETTATTWRLAAAS